MKYRQSSSSMKIPVFLKPSPLSKHSVLQNLEQMHLTWAQDNVKHYMKLRAQAYQIGLHRIPICSAEHISNVLQTNKDVLFLAVSARKLSHDGEGNHTGLVPSRC